MKHRRSFSLGPKLVMQGSRMSYTGATMVALGAFLVSLGLGGSLYQPPMPLSQTDLIADYLLTHLHADYTTQQRAAFRTFVGSLPSKSP